MRVENNRYHHACFVCSVCRIYGARRDFTNTRKG
ncbi:MAG: LIM domain-containing protein [Campylobacter curvus]